MRASVYFMVTALIHFQHANKVIPKKSETGTEENLFGPYRVELKNLQQCEDYGTGEVRFDSKSCTRCFCSTTSSREIIFYVPWDDKLVMDFEFQLLEHGKYTPRYLMRRFTSCEEYRKTGKDALERIFAAADYNFTCPLLPGKYSVKDERWLEPIHLRIPNLIYSSEERKNDRPSIDDTGFSLERKTMKIIIRLKREHKMVGCIVAHTDWFKKF